MRNSKPAGFSLDAVDNLYLVLSGFVGRANIARLSTITTAALGNCSKAILVHVSNRMSVPWLVIELPAILFHAAVAVSLESDKLVH
jgi:hypothetical protein